MIIFETYDWSKFRNDEDERRKYGIIIYDKKLTKLLFRYITRYEISSLSTILSTIEMYNNISEQDYYFDFKFNDNTIKIYPKSRGRGMMKKIILGLLYKK